MIKTAAAVALGPLLPAGASPSVLAGYKVQRDIILDLYIQNAEKRRVSVSSVCIAACVAPTTALRWIKALTLEGRLIRKGDPVDSRRFFISLAPAELKRMEDYLIDCIIRRQSLPHST